MSDDEIREEIEDLRLKHAVQQAFLAMVLAELTAKNDGVRLTLEDALWQAKTGAGTEKPGLLGALMPDVNNIVIQLLDQVNTQLEAPLQPREMPTKLR